MKERIIALLTVLDQSLYWVRDSIEFIKLEDTLAISDKPGSYSASNLLKELRIRALAASEAAIETVGMDALMSRLEAIEGDVTVENYVFKKDSRYCIVYVDKASNAVIGSILIPVTP